MILASDSTIKGLVINRFEAHGVLIFKSLSGSVFNKVEGNFIGINAKEIADLDNGVAGVSVGGVSDNTIGGTAIEAANVIGRNGFGGVEIVGSGATGNRVEGNFIGTGGNGTSDLGNGENGVRDLGPGNFVGGTVAGARNVISGNDGDGVAIFGTNSGVNTSEFSQAHTVQ